MEAIHRAALDGDVASINRLVAEDGRRLNAQVQGYIWIDADNVLGKTRIDGCTPLMLAAFRGHDALALRLLGLGADIGLRDVAYESAIDWACNGNQASALALFLDAGAQINDRSGLGHTPLMVAAQSGAAACVTLLITRGGDALDLDAKTTNGDTALHSAVCGGRAQAMQLLLHAGADPTIRNNQSRTPLDEAYKWGEEECAKLLEAAHAEPHRARSLFKARALLDAALAASKAHEAARDKGLPLAAQQQEALAIAPAYLKQRVEENQELPVCAVRIGDDEEEKLLVVFRFAVGWGGGGLLPELFTELLEYMVPKWDPARKGEPLGAEGWRDEK